MPTIPESCEFVVGPSKLYLQTNVNNSTIFISDIETDSDNLSALAFLINGENDLKVEIKVNP